MDVELIHLVRPLDVSWVKIIFAHAHPLPDSDDPDPKLIFVASLLVKHSHY